MSDAHIPNNLRAQKRAPRVLQRTHTNHRSSACGAKSEANALSKAHMSCTLRCVYSNTASAAMQSLCISWKPRLAYTTDISLIFCRNLNTYGRQKQVTWDHTFFFPGIFPRAFRGNPFFRISQVLFTNTLL